MPNLENFWSTPYLVSNTLIFLNIVGAMGLGVILGYERSYHGHAAGMRTYGLVCMSASALTVVAGFPAEWFGGAGITHGTMNAESTHIIQGIVTGIGFLGAGVIMREGFTIRGLSTAASIWATAAIGVVTGLGFYLAAILTTLLVMILLALFKRIEQRLPHYRQMRLSLTFDRDKAMSAKSLTELVEREGFTVLDLALCTDGGGTQVTYDLVIQGDGTHSFMDLAIQLGKTEQVAGYGLSPVRG